LTAPGSRPKNTHTRERGAAESHSNRFSILFPAWVTPTEHKWVILAERRGFVSPVGGVTAREIAEGTGLSLSATYRAVEELKRRGLIIEVQPLPNDGYTAREIAALTGLPLGTVRRIVRDLERRGAPIHACAWAPDSEGSRG